MSGEKNKIKVYESPVFKKAFKKLTEDEKETVDDEIDIIIENPDIGTQKKGDLSYLWVHKFQLNSQQVLLGYSWNDTELELYLLNFASHENFYQEAKNRRKADLNIIR